MIHAAILQVLDKNAANRALRANNRRVIMPLTYILGLGSGLILIYKQDSI